MVRGFSFDFVSRVMNEVQEALAEAFVDILDAFGVPVTIAGLASEQGTANQLRATMSQNDIVLEDAEAGFMKSANVDLKFLKSHLPVTLPGFKDPVIIDGESYAVVGVNTKPNSPVIVFECEPA